MPVSEQQTRKLLGILDRENSKMGECPQRAPPVFREMLSDTHKTAPAAYFGPPPALLAAMATSRSAGPSSPSYSPSASRMPNSPRLQQNPLQVPSYRIPPSASSPSGDVEYRSVFKPQPGQEHVSSLARTHRDNVRGSEWALIETLEVQMSLDDRAAKQKAAAAGRVTNRRNLDMQMQAKDLLRQEQEREVAREGVLVADQLQRFKEEEEVKAEAARARNSKLKNERETMVHQTQDARRRTKEAKAAEEKAELEYTQVQLETERKVAAARAEERRQQKLQLARENDVRIRERAAAEEALDKKDDERMQEAMRQNIQKEHEREEVSRAIFERAAARANRAGQKGLEENMERLEREERLMKQVGEQKAHEADEKERKQREKKMQLKEEMLKAREEHLVAHGRRASAERAEVALLREDAIAQEAAERQLHEAKLRNARSRAVDNQMYLTSQIMGKETKMLVDDVGMSERERFLNLQILEHAVHVVGPVPRQLSVKF